MPCEKFLLKVLHLFDTWKEIGILGIWIIIIYMIRRKSYSVGITIDLLLSNL